MAQLNLNNCQVSNSLLVKDVVISNTLAFNSSNSNIGIGTNVLSKNTTSSENIGLGNNSLSSITTGLYNVGIGVNALSSNITNSGNTAIGYDSLKNNTRQWNTGVGNASLSSNTLGFFNTAVGNNSLLSNIDASSNTGIGNNSLSSNISGSYNTGVGNNSLLNNTNGQGNTAIGNSSLSSNTTGSNNTAIGNNALSNNITFNNVTGLGANSQVTGDDQVQLGDSTSNVYAQSALNTRSDLRDKTDIRDTVLGLDFINKLRPVDFRWDVREDYIEQPKDGSKKRDRFHHGLIAQEVKSTMDNLNVDFAGYQDHKINGGKDVLTIGYEELIGPLIKSIQDFSNQLNKSNESIQDLTAEVAFLKSQLQK